MSQPPGPQDAAATAPVSMTVGAPPAAATGERVPIPYVEYHLGPRRVIWLSLRARTFVKGTTPVVGIDGRQFYVTWGDLPFEVPADRAVHLSVHVETSEGIARSASMIHLPSHAPYVHYDSGGWTSAGRFS